MQARFEGQANHPGLLRGDADGQQSYPGAGLDERGKHMQAFEFPSANRFGAYRAQPMITGRARQLPHRRVQPGVGPRDLTQRRRRDRRAPPGGEVSGSDG